MKIPEPLVEAAHRLEQRVGWQKLPLPVGVAVIAALRQRLRDRNLFDTGVPAGPVRPRRRTATATAAPGT